MLKLQKKLRSERDTVFTEEVNKIALSAKDDRVNLISSIRNICIWNEDLVPKNDKLNVTIQ